MVMAATDRDSRIAVPFDVQNADERMDRTALADHRHRCWRG